MIDLAEFRKNAENMGLCDRAKVEWDSLRDKVSVMRYALSAQGIDYVCNSIAKGWGISPSIISRDYRNFINGNFVADLGKYTGKLYCQYKGSVLVDTTIVGVIESEIELFVPRTCISEIYVTGKSKITAKGEGRCVFVVYGDDSEIIAGDKLKYKTIHKQDSAKYTK